MNQLKAQIIALKAKLPPRVAALQSTGIPSNAQSSSAPCSAKLCNYAHGTAPCPFAQQLCRWCLEPYADGHPALGRCTRSRNQVGWMEIDGVKYKQIPYASYPGKGKCKVQPRTDSLLRTTLRRYPRHPLSRKFILSQTRLKKLSTYGFSLRTSHVPFKLHQLYSATTRLRLLGY